MKILFSEKFNVEFFFRSHHFSWVQKVVLKNYLSKSVLSVFWLNNLTNIYQILNIQVLNAVASFLIFSLFQSRN